MNSKIMAILVIGGILHSGGVALERVCAYSLRSRLFFFTLISLNVNIVIFAKVNKGEG